MYLQIKFPNKCLCFHKKFGKGLRDKCARRIPPYEIYRHRHRHVEKDTHFRPRTSTPGITPCGVPASRLLSDCETYHWVLPGRRYRPKSTWVKCEQTPKQRNVNTWFTPPYPSVRPQSPVRILRSRRRGASLPGRPTRYPTRQRRCRSGPSADPGARTRDRADGSRTRYPLGYPRG